MSSSYLDGFFQIFSIFQAEYITQFLVIGFLFVQIVQGKKAQKYQLLTHI